jgi:hypothetical protein
MTFGNCGSIGANRTECYFRWCFDLALMKFDYAYTGFFVPVGSLYRVG